MPHPYRLLSLLLLILLAGCQPIRPVAPTDGTAAPAAPIAPSQDAAGQFYEDPAGRFSVPIPTNWRAETVGDYVRLTSPQAEIEVYILALPGDDAEAAIAQAWITVDPAFALEPEEIMDVPVTGGLEQIVSINYNTGEESQEIVAALGERYQGMVYALLFRGDLLAVQQRSAQLQIIQTGFTIAGREEADLAGVEPLPLTDERLAEFESYIAEAMERFAVPGAAVAIVQGDEIVYAQGFGVREAGGSDPMTPETLMMIGSTGKSMTTMMMATLVDEGLMTWDTPVQEVLPEFAVADPELSRQITMRNLVCACTGVPRRDLELFFNADELSAEDIVASLQTFEFFTEFGEAFQYSNQLVATGGYAAAAAAGGEYGNLYERYVQEMQDRIFTPIGMISTTLSFADVEASSNYAQPHGLSVDFTLTPIPLELERIVTPVAPAGAPWSNVLDMGRYLITELNQGVAPDGTRVVSAENLAVTWEPQVPVSANSSYGLGWFIDEYKGQPMIQHGGNTLGFTSDLAFLPEADLGISILTNGQYTDYFTEAVRYRLLELVFDQPQEVDAQAAFAYQAMRQSFTEPISDTVAVDPGVVEPYVGRYTNAALGDVDVRLEGDQLIFDVGEFALELRAVPDETGAVEQYITYGPPLIGVTVRFEESATGEPTLRFGEGVVEYIFTRP
jgi:CubicO group peptidase (beta-lactamase class C family)